MIQRADDAALSAASAAALFRSQVAPARMAAMADHIIDCAAGDKLAGLDLSDAKREALRLEYIRLASGYAWGRPRPQAEVPGSVDLGELGDIDECIQAMAAIGRAQMTAQVTTEQAADLRATVREAGALHRSKAGEDLLRQIEEQGADALFLEAGATADEDVERFRMGREAVHDN